MGSESVKTRAGGARGLEMLDIRVQANIAKLFWAISPTSIALALMDWASQLSISPGKQIELGRLYIEQSLRLAQYSFEVARHPLACPTQDVVTPPGFDKRFHAPEWHQWPFNITHQAFLLADEWWHAATTNIRGVSDHHEQIVHFLARQWLDVFSPGNFIATNPTVLRRTTQSRGVNLLQGALNVLEDIERTATLQLPAHMKNYQVGKNLATTPGKVILRNRLIELIQYTPVTQKTHPEPVLLIPAWIMKFYILDLSGHNSLVKYLVENGFTVFCISWKNPGWEERDLDLDDYLTLGFYESLRAINTLLPGQRVHATGYCLGGTLLAIAAAAMARDHDARLASISLFTAQTDFRESGELALFIDDSEVSLLEAQMSEAGYLSAGQMSGAFQMLRSYDLTWSRMINEYLMGERGKTNDLMAWNADTTRMPAKMHSRYLRDLFLNNALSEGRYRVNGEPVTLFNIDVPIFCVATLADHVSPWTSVYKLHYLTPSEITFVLTSGGHNAGIINSPERTDRVFQLMTRPRGGHYLPHPRWAELAPRQPGSWWPAWRDWLRTRSSEPVAAPEVGNRALGYPVLDDAPGQYVHER